MDVEQVLGFSGKVVCFPYLGVHAVASSLSLCVANPRPLIVWLRDCDQDPCLYGLVPFELCRTVKQQWVHGTPEAGIDQRAATKLWLNPWTPPPPSLT